MHVSPDAEAYPQNITVLSSLFGSRRMSSTAGHGQKTEICDCEGCSNEAERSINFKKVQKTSLTLKAGEHRNVHLCKEHYKTFKKETKEERSLNSIYRCSTSCFWEHPPAYRAATALYRPSWCAAARIPSSSTAERELSVRSWFPPSRS